jgi:DNA-binding LacI/PurR family transcriptional regulator
MTKRDQIVHAYRDEIAAGLLRPGARLPVRREIEKRFETSQVTVQHAMRQLIDEGWLSTHGCRGTCVAESPPHLQHYGLFFAFGPSESRPWARFWEVLRREAAEVFAPPATLSVFYGLDVTASMEQFQAFHATLRAQNLAGIVFASWPVPQMETILHSEPRLPCAVFASRPIPEMLTLRFPEQKLLDRACDLLVSRGRKRPAALMPGLYFTPELAASAKRSLTRHGIPHRPGWVQPMGDWRHSEAVQAQIELLFAGSECPDGLFLGDDNLIEPVAEALRRLGKRVPEDVEIVCWGMLPWPEEYSVPFHRLGLDIRSLLFAARDGIDRARRGKPLPVEILADDLVITTMADS